MKLPNPQKLTMPCFGAPSPSEQAHTLSGECKSENRSAMSDFATPWTGPWNSPGQNTGVGSLSLLQGIFPTQGLNLALPHCRWIFFFFFFLPAEPQGKPNKSTCIMLCSCSVVSDSLQPHGLQHARLPCPSPSPGVFSDSCPLSWWYHPITSSIIGFFLWRDIENLKFTGNNGGLCDFQTYMQTYLLAQFCLQLVSSPW